MEQKPDSTAEKSHSTGSTRSCPLYFQCRIIFFKLKSNINPFYMLFSSCNKIGLVYFNIVERVITALLTPSEGFVVLLSLIISAHPTFSGILLLLFIKLIFTTFLIKQKCLQANKHKSRTQQQLKSLKKFTFKQFCSTASTVLFFVLFNICYIFKPQRRIVLWDLSRRA